jgi:hypothetical protein
MDRSLKAHHFDPDSSELQAGGIDPADIMLRSG